MQQKIVPFLWFKKEAEEAAKYYVSIFKNSRIVAISRYNDFGPGPKGSVMTVTFELEGQTFIALNGESAHHFTPAISLLVNCKSQKEVDTLYKKLLAGGEELQCGWINDKFGVSWQITPTILFELIHDKNTKKAASVMQEMCKMKKINIAKIKQASRKKSKISGKTD